MSALTASARAKLVRDGVLVARPRGRPKGTGAVARIKAMRKEAARAVATSNIGEAVIADILGRLGVGF